MGTMEKPAGNGTESVVDKAKSTAADIAGAARDKVTDQATAKLGAQRDRAASGLGGVAQALRSTGNSLGDEAGLPPAVTDYVGRAAEGVERLGEYFEGKDLGEIVSDVERFARREPALFLGGAFVLGLMGARFLKSSARRSPSYDASYDRGYMRSEPNYLGYEERYGARAPRQQYTGTPTPTPMAPPRRDPTMNTASTAAGSVNPMGSVGAVGGGAGSVAGTSPSPTGSVVGGTPGIGGNRGPGSMGTT